MSAHPTPTAPDARRPPRWFLILALLWLLLALRIGLALVRGETLRDELSLPTIALVVTTALLGNVVYAKIQTRRQPD
jgi:hypothetical protein